jgi:hypothetical protein
MRGEGYQRSGAIGNLEHLLYSDRSSARLLPPAGVFNKLTWTQESFFAHRCVSSELTHGLAYADYDDMAIHTTTPPARHCGERCPLAVEHSMNAKSTLSKV